MDDFVERMLTEEGLESVLRVKHPDIFDKFEIFRIRSAIEQVVKEVFSLRTEKSDKAKDTDSWNADVIDDFLPGNVLEILESYKNLTEDMKSFFYLALVNGHIDRASQLKNVFTDIDFSNEIEDAFNDVIAHNKKYLAEEIAQFHPKLSYKELLIKLVEIESD